MDTCDGGLVHAGVYPLYYSQLYSSTHYISSQVTTKQHLLRSAVATHERLTRDAMTGRGVDRHLFGLQQMPDPDSAELFSDDIFNRSQTWRLSTSGLSAGHLFRGTGCVRVVQCVCEMLIALLQVRCTIA
jgi:hypothetical protein